MIWEQKPSGIVMVTKLFELTRVIVVHNYIPYMVFTKIFYTRQGSDTISGYISDVLILRVGPVQFRLGYCLPRVGNYLAKFHVIFKLVKKMVVIWVLGHSESKSGLHFFSLRNYPQIMGYALT